VQHNSNRARFSKATPNQLNQHASRYHPHEIFFPKTAESLANIVKTRALDWWFKLIDWIASQQQTDY
jgi:hypothetical protein